MSTLSPNMGLILPTINVDSGLVWEQSVISDLTILDNHDHSGGNGVQIPPSGLNINSDLPFQGNSATNLKSLVLANQVSNSTLNSIYAIGGELYWNDGASNVVKMTSGGTVNATSSGITSGTATASFAGAVLVVNSAPATPANIQGRSILLGNNVASSKFLTLSPPGAMAANYSLTLPSLPGSTSVVSLDTSGNLATGVAGSVVTNDLASNCVTYSKLAAQNEAISSSTGALSTSASNPTIATTGSITTTGRRVLVTLMPDGSIGTSLASYIALLSGSLQICYFLIQRSGTTVATFRLEKDYSQSGYFSTSAITFYDKPAAGTYTYSLTALTFGDSIQVFYSVLYAVQL